MISRDLRAFALFVFVLAPAFVQQQEPPPTIKSRADLVLVPAVVTQGGKPVKGLTVNEFVLLHNGRREQIAEFEEIEAMPAKVGSVVLPPQTVQNYASADSRQDVVILLLDYLNSDHFTDANIRRRFSAVVQEFMATNTPVTVLILSYKGLIRVHSYSSDAENLVMAAERWSSKKSARENNMSKGLPDWASPLSSTDGTYTAHALQRFAVLPEKAPRDADFVPAYELDRQAMTFRAIEQLTESFRGIPGRKKLIWMSTRALQTASFTAGENSANALEEQSMRAWKSLNDANIAVHWIIANRLVSTGAAAGAFSAENNFSCFPTSATRLAFSTGGNVCDEDPAMCIKRPLADTHYYLLGFYLHGEHKPGWHALKVTVHQPKTAVRAREGFVFGESAELNTLNTIDKDVLVVASRKDDALRVALSSPLDYTSIPLRLQWSVTSTLGKDVQVELVVSSPPGGIEANADDMSLNVDFLAFFKPVGAKEGQPFPSTLKTVLNPEQQRTFAKTGFRFRNVVTIAPARYEVRVLVRDNEARKIGTVSTIIDLTTSPAPALSGILP